VRADDGSACYASLSPLGLALGTFAAGQRNAGTRDILVYGNGAPQLWSLDP
jgi:hypothetical protein